MRHAPNGGILGEHLDRLAESLRALKDRVQDAVAGELARAVGQTAQDVIRSALERPTAATPHAPRRGYDPWGYDDEPGDHGEFGDFGPLDPPLRPVAAAPPARARLAWVAAAGRALLNCLARPARPWWPLALLAGAGAAALAPHPLLVALSAALRAAAELLGA